MVAALATNWMSVEELEAHAGRFEGVYSAKVDTGSQT